ncbi:MAG: SDR family NAD(P)-dependent oxidoreductase [Burkholderiales bacterium]
MFKSIQDRSVIVTGGSKGIGKGIAQVFASYGAKILIVGRSEATARAAVEEIREKRGTAEHCLADVSIWDDVC